MYCTNAIQFKLIEDIIIFSIAECSNITSESPIMSSKYDNFPYRIDRTNHGVGL